MIRTQIHLPDALHERAKEIAKRHEISLAELVRRGLEHMTRLYPVEEQDVDEWTLPAPLALGGFRSPEESWRELANSPDDDRPDAG